jgi:methylmalonyl-CoA mutase
MSDVDSRKEWWQAAAKELKGGDPLKDLAWTADAHLAMRPYYTQEDETGWEWLKPYQGHLGRKGPMINYVAVPVHTPQQANAQALAALQAGAEGILFQSDAPLTADRVEILINNILPEHCGVAFQLTHPDTVGFYLDYLAEKGSSVLHGFVLSEGFVTSAESLHKIKEADNFFMGTAQAETSRSEALAQWLCRVVNQINLAEKSGEENSKLFQKMLAHFTAGSSYFEDIAMLRAARLLGFKLAGAYGLNDFTPSQLQVFVEMPAFIHPNYAPHGTMLYHATAAMAAIIGGANAVLLHAEDSSQSMMSRIARNTPLILKEESYLDKVIDPAAGSYFIEQLTAGIAESAWAKFLALQSAS